jgi:hypothetical protein
MGLAGRYFSARDLKVINSWSAELMGDIIQTQVTIYKVAVQEMKTNIYGEADQLSGGITFYPGVEITSLVAREDLNTEYDNFGPDRSQNVVFKFRESMLKIINLYPELGDIIYFNARYYECDNIVNDEQLLGGIPEKSFSIIVHSHYTKLSKINLVNRGY